MVELEATDMAQAVIDEGKKGQLATVKYLFEVAEIFPPATDGGQSTSEEDCLAKTLLHRLNLPEEPIKPEDDDEPVTVVIPANSVVKREPGEGENRQSVGEEQKVDVAAPSAVESAGEGDDLEDAEESKSENRRDR